MGVFLLDLEDIYLAYTDNVSNIEVRNRTKRSTRHHEDLLTTVKETEAGVEKDMPPDHPA